MQKELLAVKHWLKKEGNTKTKLAYELGYTSSTTITMWFKRNRVPNHMKQRLYKEISK